jgi:transcriptional regulator with GAF, ATPase, and Fis domain
VDPRLITGHAEVTADPSRPLGDPAALSTGERLRVLYEVGRRILEPREPGEIVETVLRSLVATLAPEQACVLSLADDGRLEPLAQHGLDLGPDPGKWPLSRSVLQRVRDSGLALLASDVRSDDRFESSGSAQRLGIRSVLCVPLGPVPIRGLIYLDRRGEGECFSREDLEFLTALAAYVSPVLRRAEEYAGTARALALSDERRRLLEGELLRHRIVGRSPALLAAYDTVRRFASRGARVLLRGETGTGKELFARAYAENSPRPAGPYVPVPIPALAPGLIESELFGHVRGAFTEATRDKKGRLELADGGLLFLDEVGDIDSAVQPKLLRFLDSGELFRVGDTQARVVDALVVSATNRPLERDVERGGFRADLLARLGHVVHLPPLRERPDDIPPLVEHFLARHGRGEPARAFSPSALERLQAYSWPLNVRELQQVVERAVCLVDRPSIEADDLGPELLPKQSRSATAGAALPGPLREVTDDAARRHILRTLEYTGGNRRRAIEILEISPDTFYRRLLELGIGRKGT